MGYQESLVYLRPQGLFDRMIQAAAAVKKTDYYQLFGAEPMSVITLKQPMEGLPAGAKLLWVCGDRGFHTEQGIFNGKLPFRGLYRLKVIPAEKLFNPSGDTRLEHILLDEQDKTTGNAFLTHESFAHYSHRLQSREMER